MAGGRRGKSEKFCDDPSTCEVSEFVWKHKGKECDPDLCVSNNETLIIFSPQPSMTGIWRLMPKVGTVVKPKGMFTLIVHPSV